MTTYVLTSESPITFTPDVPSAFAPVTLTPISLTGQPSAEFDLPQGWTEAKVMFAAASLSGSDCFLVQLYIDGAWVTSGYASSSAIAPNGSSAIGVFSTAGFIVFNNGNLNAVSGSMVLSMFSPTVIEADHTAIIEGSASLIGGGGRKVITIAPTKLRVIGSSSNLLDAGAVNVSLR